MGILQIQKENRMTIPKGYGYSYARDKESEPLETTLKYGIKAFLDKYKDNTIDWIECSLKDRQEKFIYEGIEVRPYRRILVGTIWIKPVEIKNKMEN